MQTHALYRDKIIQIASNQLLQNIVFEQCVISAGPDSSIAFAENVQCTSCIFLYDGMQVDDEEWMALIQRRPLVRLRH